MERIPCQPTPDCPVVGCPAEDRHHLYYPKHEYTTDLEKEFRSLGSNIVRICRRTHLAVHKDLEPLDKPSVEEMAEAVVTEQRDYTPVRLRKLVDNLIRRTG